MAQIAFTTTETTESAEKLGRQLVEKELAACVNIMPKVKSVFRWEGNVEEGEESLLIIKTTEENLEKLKEEIADLHSYENPEFLAVSVDEGLEKYLTWLENSVD